MRIIKAGKIIDTVKELCIQSAYNLPEDVINAVRSAIDRESNPQAREVLNKILQNAEVARKELYPLCQDTGLAIIFVDIGKNIFVDTEDYPTLTDVINEGVKRGYEEGYLRKSVVDDPANERKNTQTNTPAIIHYDFTDSDGFKISVLLKGGGSENKSRFKMLRPTADKSEIIDFVLESVKLAGADACPPFIIGVGIGGNFEKSTILAKKSLLRQIGLHHPNPFYSELEREILDEVNKLGLGPAGFGGDTTALWVAIETFPSHIASLPIAVNIECHSHRHMSAEL